MISDICLKSQLFFECMYWQEICSRAPLNLGLILEHITNSTEVQIISMYHRLITIWDTGKKLQVFNPLNFRKLPS